MNAAATLTLTAAAVLLIAASSKARANVEAGEGSASFDLGNLTDTIEATMNQITEQAADVPGSTAGDNLAAFLATVRHAEGTAGSTDPYRVCFGYEHSIQSFADHPALTGEWLGKRLPDAMCKNAGFGPGCVSTAAGAYQIIRPTWLKMQAALSLPDFGPASQDAAATELIRRRGALEDVKAGRMTDAVHKCRNEWASLPGNYAKQGQRNIETLAQWFEQNGGTIA
jgi:muramidase (phage lysozyme)